VTVRGSLVALILGEMAFVAFVLWLASTFVRERTRERAELQARMIERFGSAQELVAFLATEAGRGMGRSLLGHREVQTRQVLVAVQLGIVLVATSAGLGVAARLQQDRDLFAWALACATAGTGMLIAAAVSRRLARRWAAQDAVDTTR
jgi:uncharacterized membrane protein YfcA